MGCQLESRSKDEMEERRRLTLDQGLGESQRQRTKSSSETCRQPEHNQNVSEPSRVDRTEGGGG